MTITTEQDVKCSVDQGMIALDIMYVTKMVLNCVFRDGMANSVKQVHNLKSTCCEIYIYAFIHSIKVKMADTFTQYLQMELLFSWYGISRLVNKISKDIE